MVDLSTELVHDLIHDLLSCTLNSCYYDFNSHHPAIPDTLCALDLSYNWMALSPVLCWRWYKKRPQKQRGERWDEDVMNCYIWAHKQKQARFKVLLKTFKEVLCTLSMQALWPWREINTQILIIVLLYICEIERHSIYSDQLNIYIIHTQYMNHNSYI